MAVVVAVVAAVAEVLLLHLVSVRPSLVPLREHCLVSRQIY